MINYLVQHIIGWESYIFLEKKFRDAALIFAEGYQKFPQSIKAPDMLYKFHNLFMK